MYTPKPINTEDIQIPSDLMRLTEEIATNVHDVWAAGRISEGWTYGEVKDADKKIHHSSYRTMSFRKARKSMIEIQLLRP